MKSRNIEEILEEMKEICDVWVKVDGDMKAYNQDEIHCIYNYIERLQGELKDIFDENERLKEEKMILLQDIRNIKNNFELGKLNTATAIVMQQREIELENMKTIECKDLKQQNKILNNKLNMIKHNIDKLNKEKILEIIDNYTGFFGIPEK